MQVNSVSSLNFRANESNFTPESEYDNCGIPIYTESDMDSFKKVVDKTESNVNPVTIVVTAITTLLAAISVKKFVPVLRRSVVKFSQLAADGFTKLKGKVKKLDAQEVSEKIAKRADKVKEMFAKENTEDSKMLGGIKDFVSDIFGKETGEKTEKVLRNIGVVNKTGVVDAATASVIAATTIDPVSDNVEERADNRTIKKAYDEITKIANDSSVRSGISQLGAVVEALGG